MAGAGGAATAARNTAICNQGWVFDAGYQGLITHSTLQAITREKFVKLGYPGLQKHGTWHSRCQAT